MALEATAAKNAALDACYGGSRSSVWPSTLVVRLYDGDPSASGSELPADGGYSAVTVNNDTAQWPAASGGIKTSDWVDFGTSSAAWGAVATWVGVHHPGTGALWERVALADRVNVSVAGTNVQVQVAIFFDHQVP